MEKKLVQFFIITVLFLVGYQYVVSKMYPRKGLSSISGTEQPRIQAPAHPSMQQAEQEGVTDILAGVPDAGELVEIEVENFVVTVSLTGGYIKNVHHKMYNETLSFQNIGYIPAFKDTQFILSVPQKNKIVLENEQLGVKKIWEFVGYAVRFRLLLPQDNTAMVLFSNPPSSNMLNQRYQEVFYKEDSSQIMVRMNLRKIKELKKDIVRMAGARDRFFCIAFFDNTFPLLLSRTDKNMVANTTVYDKETIWNFYLGPQIADELTYYNLGDIIHYGFFHPIGVIMIKVLRFCHSFSKNWGVSIILLSIGIYLLLFPLTFKSSKGMKEMRDFQKTHKAEIAKLKEKYKNQPDKIQKETMLLYKKYGFNPLKGCSSGCLPLFFQMPIILAFWNVVPRALDFKGARFLWIRDLSMADKTFLLPFNVPMIGNSINVLPIVTAIVMYLQMKFTSPEMDSEHAQQQKMMALMFPVMIGAFTYKLPSALLLYWFTNSLLTFFSQWKILKTK